jgi:hypothetical protein
MYLLAGDRTAMFVERGTGRALSVYERAFLRLFVMGLIDECSRSTRPFAWLARRFTFAPARRPRDYEAPILDVEFGLPECAAMSGLWWSGALRSGCYGVGSQPHGWCEPR